MNMENKEWYNSLKKSPYTPPNNTFRTVWGFLYLSMILSFTLIYADKNCNPFCNALTIFFVHLFFNLIWSPIFFIYKEIFFALLDIAIMIITVFLFMYEFYKINLLATIILIPYTLWIMFAFYLNLYIYLNN